ncbi:MAG: sialate O-acetylesterase, partial [Muribaculaceae bacterium]|nr:sialate O-acetylesterase [Muribaculaceae bacterium]
SGRCVLETGVDFVAHRDGLCRNYDIEGFEVAGEDKVFHPAKVVGIDDQKAYVILSSPEVAAPLYVRYCFHDFQLGNMCGADFLPLVPFRSDR